MENNECDAMGCCSAEGAAACHEHLQGALCGISKRQQGPWTLVQPLKLMLFSFLLLLCLLLWASHSLSTEEALIAFIATALLGWKGNAVTEKDLQH